MSFHTPIRCDISALDLKERRKAINELKYSMNIAVRLGAKNVVVHPSTTIEEDDSFRNERRKQSKNSVMEIFEYSQKKGFTLLLENIPGSYFCNSVFNLLEFIEEIGEPKIKVCLDIGHANLRNEVISGLKVLKNRVVQLHIHDNDGITDQHLPPGEGKINWDLFRTMLKETEFNGHLVYEGYGGLDGIEKFKNKMKRGRI
ncbi:MAG: sugar phosphate isomerase/epimerase family protein [Candidatus Theseobacter exili]|nr:sugar phosphate isomerase/epimerase family protein [Candidatus Theseobacter exili]